MYRLLGIFVALLVFFLVLPTQPIRAQSCGGSGYVCWWGEYCDGERDPITRECLGTIEYRYSTNVGCGEYPSCGVVPDTYTCEKWTGSCYNVDPSSCGDGTCDADESCDTCAADCGTCSSDPPPPPPSDTCAGSCHTGIANCGEIGYESASGTCSAGICCQPKTGSGDYCNCCNDPAWTSQAGNPEPGFDECLAGYDPHWETGYYAGVNGECALCACTPSCPVACGQADGCGGTCANTDSGVPTTPSFTTPSYAGQMLMTNTSGQITLSWSTVAKADYYQLALHNGLTGDHIGTYNTGSSYTFTPTLTNYIAQVRAVNNTCSNQYSEWSPQRPFLVGALVQGHIYTDPDAVISAGMCSGDPGALSGDEGILTVSGQHATSGYTNSTTATGNSYALPMSIASFGEVGVTLDIQNSSYICACPAGCSYPSVNSPQTGVDFYLVEAADAWFQVTGGPVMARQTSGLSLTNALSSFCYPPACEPALIRNLTGAGTAGYAMIGPSADIDLSREEPGYQETPIDENDDNWLVRTQMPTKQEDYAYFARIMFLPPDAVSDFGSNGQLAQLHKPAGTPVNSDTTAYFHRGEAVLDQVWDVSAGESYVVLVDGDVTIEAQTQVAEGGFLAIIASGDIIIDPVLGHDDASLTESVLEGVFVASGQLRLPSRGPAAGGDKKFVGEGTFVGWDGVILERDYDNDAGRRALNNTYPTELFRYRPDFIMHAPDDFKRPQFNWRQLP